MVVPVRLLQKRGNSVIFRVNLRIYPRELAERVFGRGREVEHYLVFEKQLSEKEVLEGFASMLEELSYGSI